MSDPHEWHVASDKEGFFIEDEYGEEVIPTWLPATAGWRCQSMKTANYVRSMLIAEAVDNYEPPDPPGWEGGFAEDH
jgi:hypothetical protein